MFKIETPKVLSWPVTVNIPRDGGNTTQAIFNGKFRMISTGEFNAIYNNGGNDEDLIRNVFVGWGSDLCDESGNPMEFNEANLNLAIAMPYVRNGIVTAYLELSQGKKAAAKN